MAAPHVTGLAALILAHRPEFQGLGRMRSPERVERLFQIIRLSARRVSLADPSHIGSGMPDALAALGLPLIPVQGAGAWQQMMGGFAGNGDGNGARIPVFAGAPYFAGAQVGIQPMGFGFPMGGMPPPGW